jgi:hypothetical protein
LFQNASPRPLVAILPALVPALVLCLAGCGGNRPPVGQVSGKVTFKGKPVGEGLVTFMNPEAGTGDEAPLNKDGTYTLATPLPVGDYKVMVLPLVVQQQVDGKGPEVGVEKPAPDIPGKYRTIGTTALKATVKEGKNDLDFDMTP